MQTSVAMVRTLPLHCRALITSIDMEGFVDVHELRRLCILYHLDENLLEKVLDSIDVLPNGLVDYTQVHTIHTIDAASFSA